MLISLIFSPTQNKLYFINNVTAKQSINWVCIFPLTLKAPFNNYSNSYVRFGGVVWGLQRIKILATFVPSVIFSQLGKMIVRLESWVWNFQNSFRISMTTWTLKNCFLLYICQNSAQWFYPCQNVEIHRKLFISLPTHKRVPMEGTQNVLQCSK